MNDSTYALILGQGRSGTNWLLDLLDLSPRTYCRNEPNEMAGSALAALPSGWVHGAFNGSFAEAWDRAVALAAHRVGYRDHHLQVDKPFVRWRKLDRIVKGPKLRRAVSVLQPSLRAEEWAAPWWWADRGRMAEAMTVLKLNSVPAWADWVIAHRPAARSLHIVRHPGGFLNSYRNRWLKHEDRDRVLADNTGRLRSIVAAHPDWARRFGDIDAMGIEESELWFWLYASETIEAAGQKHPDRYLRIVYEDLVADTVAVAQRAYRLCGLPWTDATAQRVADSAGESDQIARAWRDRIDADLVAIIDRILAGSPMNAWWSA